MIVSRVAAGLAAKPADAHFAAMDTPRFLSGKLLLAMPGIGDPRFERAVIALCVHDENGAVGIGIGHEREGMGVRGLLEQLGLDPGTMADRPVLHGGPVEPGRGFVLHSDDWGGQDTIAVTGLGALTGTIDVLKAIAEGRGPSRYLIALGYAGWGEGQLDEEMTRPGWFTATGRQQILFDTPTSERWEAGFKAEGIDPRLLDSAAGVA
jgi:putative transcriptional regulator